MIVGIDGSSILPRRTGVGHYTYHLLRSLAELGGNESFRVFLNSLRHPFPADATFLRGPHFKTRRTRIPGPWLVTAWRRLGAPSIEWFVGRCDVFHSPATYVPPQRAGARVTTVHDLYFMRRPEECHSLGGKYLAEYLPRAVPKLDRIIVASQSTASDVVELLDVEPERVRVVYHGVDERFRPVTDQGLLANAKRRYGLDSEFILTVATLEPRKNVERLLRAYALLRESGVEPPPLVLAGGAGWQTDAIFRTVEELRLKDRVRFIGYVDGGDLPALYTLASVFVFISLYEGFGLPLLEAMACGTPSVASRASSLGEVAGDAALPVDPLDVETIAAAMKEALENEPTRERLRQRGLARAAQFSWRRCAEETLAVYREAVEEKRL